MMLRSAAAAALAAAALIGCGGGAEPVAPPVPLEVSVTGGGTIGSQPAGIDCGSMCSAVFSPGTSVTLTATASAGARFAGWGGACSGTTTGCVITMNEARRVTAAFVPVQVGVTYNLTLSVTGSGRVTSAPAGIDCGTTCTGSFASDTRVVLSAAPASGQTFVGWAGACSGTAPTCSVTMSAAQSVAATFAAVPATSWSDTAIVSPAGAEQPRISIDTAGNATVIWRQLDAGMARRSLWASRRPAGGSWSTPVVVESSDNDVLDAALAVDAASGRAMVIWSEQAGNVLDVRARVVEPTGSFGLTALISGAGRNNARLSVAWDGRGNAVALWNQTDASANNSVWSNRYTTAGGWGSAVRVADDGAQDLDPSLAVASTGEAFVVWSRLGSGIWASRADANGTWGTPVQLVAGLINVNVAVPRVVADPNGNAIAVWSQSGVSAGQSVTNLVSRRFSGGAWSANSAALYAPVVTTVFSEARLAVNAQGRLVAVWALADGSVRAARSDDGVAWSTPATVRPAGSQIRSVPDVGIDSQTDVTAIWAERGAGASLDQVWINRLSAGAWSTPTMHQQSMDASATPRVAVNTRGDAVAVWIRFGSDGSQVVSRSLGAAR